MKELKRDKKYSFRFKLNGKEYECIAKLAEISKYISYPTESEEGDYIHLYEIDINSDHPSYDFPSAFPHKNLISAIPINKLTFRDAIWRDFGNLHKLQDSVAAFDAFEDKTVSPCLVGIRRQSLGSKKIETFHSRMPVRYENYEYIETIN